MHADDFDADKGFEIKKRKHEEVHIDFTPMIDCMFLLLMFNMIAFTLTGSSDLDMPKARYATGNDAADATTITIRQPAAPGDPSHVEIEGVEKTGSATLEEIRTAIQQAAAEGKMQVVIKAEKRVPIRELMDVASQVGEVEGTSLLLAVHHETSDH
jgi:biopolymer transport protein ExbD